MPQREIKGRELGRSTQSCLRSVLLSIQDISTPNKEEFRKDAIAARQCIFSLQQLSKIQNDCSIVSRLEEMEDAIARCEENSIECMRELRIIKALFVCCFAMVFMYLTYA
ncbi:hypothetical protein HID58_070948 [Brassica napus]|uniref:Uncharacterized protein n=1 Tax=Brassica napus TaxID=3708 RepID=A0ABQ7Z065_BRANA|nr:hypothetical protein HID58_070948 [Brassica napus]